MVEQEDPELLVEAVTQVQQACEKATKAIMLAQGKPYDDVKGMGHNSIGAFVTLIADMLDANPLARDFSQALLNGNSTEAAKTLARLVLHGRGGKENKDQVMYAFKQILPPASRTLGNKALEVDEWKRLTRAFPPKVVELFIEFHEYHGGLWSQYINEIPNMYVDPRPLLDKRVSVETWVFSEGHAGLPRGFPGQETGASTSPVLENLAQQLLNDFLEQGIDQVDRSHWPKAVNTRRILLHISNWLTALSWLFLCATVTTPHAVSSRYPAPRSSTAKEVGSQHYNKQLGVVACIGPLAEHTEQAIQNLIKHYRQIGSGYSQMFR